MSSNRANASARNRRAGGAEMNPQQQQQQQQQQRGQPQQQRGLPQQQRGLPQQRGQPQRGQQPQVQQQVPKLSISDAIGLITLRLGKVEGIIQNIQIDQLRQGDSGMELNENSRIVDDSVFKSIVSRLDVLEKNQKALMDNQTTLSNSMKSLALKTSASTNGAPVSQVTQTIVKDISDEKLFAIHENIGNVRTEINSVKDSLVKLQHFTTETNQKLMDFVLEYNGDENEIVHNDAVIFDEEEDIKLTNLQIVEDADEGEVTEVSDLDDFNELNNLKSINMSDEILQSELSSIHVSGIDCE